MESATPEAILGWTWEQFAPDVILTCSFQHDGVVLAHMLRTIAPEVPVVFVNTGFHFPETLAYRDLLVERFGFRLVELEPIMPRAEFAERISILRANPDSATSTRQQSCPALPARVDQRPAARSGVHAQRDPRREAYRAALQNPLAWTTRDTFYYPSNGIPTHPLFDARQHLAARPVDFSTSPANERTAVGRDKVEVMHTFLTSGCRSSAANRRRRRLPGHRPGQLQQRPPEPLHEPAMQYVDGPQPPGPASGQCPGPAPGARRRARRERRRAADGSSGSRSPARTIAGTDPAGGRPGSGDAEDGGHGPRRAASPRRMEADR